MTSVAVAMNNCSHLIEIKMIATKTMTHLLPSLPSPPQMETVVNSARIPRPSSIIEMPARLLGKASLTVAIVVR